MVIYHISGLTESEQAEYHRTGIKMLIAYISGVVWHIDRR